MRTKNAKRLWPVPATVAVMAVVAFLAFGLLATNSARPAEAQDDADCTFTLDGDQASPTITPPTGMACSAFGDTATVKFTGLDMPPTLGILTQSQTDIYVLVLDDKRRLGILPNRYDLARSGLGGW